MSLTFNWNNKQEVRKTYKSSMADMMKQGTQHETTMKDWVKRKMQGTRQVEKYERTNILSK
jgi:hypothetical protein